MKKLFTGILALLMAFGCLAACNQTEDNSSSNSTSNSVSDSTSDNSTSETPALTHAADLRDVKTAFLVPIASEASSSNKAYTVRNKFSFDGEDEVYTINWSVADDSGNAVEGVSLQKGTGDTDAVIISVTEDKDYVLTATITCPDGCCTSEPYSINRKAVASAVVPVAITEAPQENVAYKLYVYQSAISTDCYLTGEPKPNYPWYLLSDPDYNAAIDLYVKNVTGGFNIYAEVDGETKYLSIVKTGGHTSSFFMTVEELQQQEDCENTLQSVWTWDAEMGTVVTMLEDDKCYMGCNGTYDTISAQYKTASNIYPGYLCEMKAAGSVVVEDADKVDTTLNELSVVEKITTDAKAQLTLATQGSKYAEVSVAWSIESEYAELTANIVEFTIPTEAATVTLTATVTCGDVTKTKDFPIQLGPKSVEIADKTDTAAILAAAKNLAKDEELPGTYSLTGQITSVDTAWDSEYKNITVSILVGDTSLKCYRLKNADGVEAASALKVGDVITVSGTLMNYNGKVQFGQGCVLTAVTEGEAGGETTLAPAEIVDAAYALAPGATLGLQTLTGVVTEFTEYNDYYGNATFTIVVENKTDKPILCYRVKGDDAASVKVGDTVTVTGELMNYLSNSAEAGDPGKVEFSGGTVTIVESAPDSGDNGDEDDNTGNENTGATEMTIAEALQAANGATVTITGTVTRLYEEWSSYNNMSPYISDGTGEILIFRTTTKVAIGDVIKVTGDITVYNNVNQIAQGTSTVEITQAHTCEYNEATCEVPASCKFCGEAKDNVLGNHNYVDGLCSVCNGVDPDYEGTVVVPQELELVFDKANRTSQTSETQVWEANGVKLTNNKGSSTSNVADYAAPARFYKSSQLIVECAGMKKIEFTCNSTSYATALVSSIGTMNGVTVTSSGKVVTVEFAEKVDSFTVESLTGGQVRMDSLTVTA